MQPQPPTPKRFYLLSYPRTASNLLIKILALENQPSLLPNSKSEYFFVKTLPWKLGPAKLGGKAISKWSEDEKVGLKKCFRECTSELVDVCERAEREGKDIFIKEHVIWILNPVAETSWVFGEKEEEKGMNDENSWIANDSVAQTHSTGNETVFSDEFLKTWFVRISTTSTYLRSMSDSITL